MANDLISRQAAIDALDEIRHALWEIDIPSPTVSEYVEHHEQVQSVWKLLDKKQKELYVLPSAQPYTDEEIQKIQELEQAEIQKAFQLGREDALSEIIRCKDCKHWYSDADTGMACEFTNMSQPEDGYCNWSERRTDEIN